MDQSSMSNSTEDISSITTENDITSLSPDTQQMPATDFNTQCEQLQVQIQELTKELNESHSAEKRANDERDKYLQMYNRTSDRFLGFERKQLDQMRHILTMVTTDQHKVLSDNQDDYRRPRRAFTSPSTSILLPSSLDQPLDGSDTKNNNHRTEADIEKLLTQISEIMDLSEKFSARCSQQIDENNKLRLINNQKQDENIKLVFDLSLTKAEYEKEQQVRNNFEKQFNEANQVIEQDRSKRLQKLRNYALLADDEGDILLSSLMKKAEKNDADLDEMKSQYESAFIEQANHIKKLVKERELLHLYIQRLEHENASLAAITNDDETVKLLTHSSQSPTTLEDAWSLINKLREEIIQQMKVQDKLKNDIQQSQYNHKTDLREREQIEELFNRDLTAAKDEILVLQTVQGEYERILILKNDLEKRFDQCNNELIATKVVANSLTIKLKEKIEEISMEKETVDEDNAGLRVQIKKLRHDFENSESVQHDFVKLSQALQVQLEEFRNSGNELRWQSEEDFSSCQRCNQSFSVTWRKHHCRHCGKVLCKDCTNKIVHTGPNNRPSRVCDVCYTLLNKTSPPYFLSGVPKV